MKIKPILFNTDMVRAILDGRKTVTRRAVKRKGYDDLIHNPENNYACNRNDGYWAIGYDARPIRCWPQGAVGVRQPYSPGDILYVRETWGKDGKWFLFRAWEHGRGESEKQDEAIRRLGLKWRPSIHMPREAARIFLRVTDVRVERLQDMRLTDCLAEGVQLTAAEEDDKAKAPIAARDRFSAVWDSTIKPADRERYGWVANPWVWVIEFERYEKPETT